MVGVGALEDDDDVDHIAPQQNFVSTFNSF